MSIAQVLLKKANHKMVYRFRLPFNVMKISNAFNAAKNLNITDVHTNSY